MLVFVDFEHTETINMVNDLLADEKYCKKLLGLYLGTSSDMIVNRYYSVYKKFRRNGHFDPEIEGGAFSWNWAAFCFAPFFFWYRKQYGYMVGVVITMFFFFFPGLILAGAIADMAILNDFALTIATAIDEAELDEEIMKKYDNLGEDASREETIKFIVDNVLPFVEKECKSNGGTNEYAYIIPITIIGLIVIVANSS